VDANYVVQTNRTNQNADSVIIGIEQALSEFTRGLRMHKLCLDSGSTGLDMDADKVDTNMKDRKHMRERTKLLRRRRRQSETVRSSSSRGSKPKMTPQLNDSKSGRTSGKAAGERSSTKRRKHRKMNGDILTAAIATRSTTLSPSPTPSIAKKTITQTSTNQGGGSDYSNLIGKKVLRRYDKYGTFPGRITKADACESKSRPGGFTIRYKSGCIEHNVTLDLARQMLDDSGERSTKDSTSIGWATSTKDSSEASTKKLNAYTSPMAACHIERNIVFSLALFNVSPG